MAQVPCIGFIVARFVKHRWTVFWTWCIFLAESWRFQAILLASQPFWKWRLFGGLLSSKQVNVKLLQDWTPAIVGVWAPWPNPVVFFRVRGWEKMESCHLRKIHLPETNSSPLKIGHLKRKQIVFQPSIFRCKLAVSFKEGTSPNWLPFSEC